MTTIRRLTDSCVLITTDDHGTLIDPGFHTFQSGEVDLGSIDVDRVLITHEHRDHVSPEFVRWLIDRRSDLTVYTNSSVAELLDDEGITATTETPPGVTAEDVLHEPVPTGAQPPNRSFTVEDVLTHPGDSHQPTQTAPVLALPLIAPWTSATAAVAFALRLGPRQVVPIHDYYLSGAGRRAIWSIASHALGEIDLVTLDWGEQFTV
jgi:L-ascorbate metabolism protein UlaG (beta-lactamase superfamily)